MTTFGVNAFGTQPFGGGVPSSPPEPDEGTLSHKTAGAFVSASISHKTAGSFVVGIVRHKTAGAFSP